MVQESLEKLREELRETLYLDLDDFGLDTQGEEVVSKFIGLQLRSAFQPIYRADHLAAPLGYEALLRPSIGEQDQVSPIFAFSFADNQGRLVKFDRVARTLHTLNYLHLPVDKGLLFLNVHPKLLVSVNAHGKVFERILHANSVPTQQVVIEILENAIEVDRQLNEAITNYRDRGYQIAVDNFGSKHSNLDRLWRLSPDFVKLDLSLIKEAEINHKVRRVLPKLVEIVAELGAQAVVEGIETDTQYKIALDAGAPLLQGYYLGKPSSATQWRATASAEPRRAAA